VNLAASLGYGVLSVAFVIAAVALVRYRKDFLAWNQQVVQRNYEFHPALTLWREPSPQEPPHWLWIPFAVFLVMNACVFAIAAIAQL
jgi:hypothetical protein